MSRRVVIAGRPAAMFGLTTPKAQGLSIGATCRTAILGHPRGRNMEEPASIRPRSPIQAKRPAADAGSLLIQAGSLLIRTEPAGAQFHRNDPQPAALT